MVDMVVSTSPVWGPPKLFCLFIAINGYLDDLGVALWLKKHPYFMVYHHDLMEELVVKKNRSTKRLLQSITAYRLLGFLFNPKKHRCYKLFITY